MTGVLAAFGTFDSSRGAGDDVKVFRMGGGLGAAGWIWEPGGIRWRSGARPPSTPAPHSASNGLHWVI